jgi:ribonuclease HI
MLWSLLKIAQLREGLGIATNNAAEYRALILGLKYAAKKGFKYIRAQGDSKLVCNQVSGDSFLLRSLYVLLWTINQ